MNKVLNDAWRLLVFFAEVVCVLVFGVPLGLILGLFGGIAIYVFVFRMLGQELAAMWRKHAARNNVHYMTTACGQSADFFKSRPDLARELLKAAKESEFRN